ncbi:MAG TPA: hypothetical protein VJ841_05440 [Candidatus Saccharimonadales bacterium]|nr:hypothetical protein [Candidatus Saccharimonadales bacterium]
MPNGKVIRKNKGPNERHYTWSGGTFPRPDTSALTFTNGVTVEVHDDKLIVRVDDVNKWRLVHEAAVRAVAIAAGGTGIKRVE